MSTETPEKGSTVGGVLGENSFSSVKLPPVGDWGRIINSPMKLRHQELPFSLKSFIRPSLPSLNEELIKVHDLVLFHFSLYRNLCVFQVDKMNYVSLSKQVTPSQVSRLLHQNYSATNEHFYVALLYHVGQHPNIGGAD